MIILLKRSSTNFYFFQGGELYNTFPGSSGSCAKNPQCLEWCHSRQSWGWRLHVWKLKRKHPAMWSLQRSELWGLLLIKAWCIVVKAGNRFWPGRRMDWKIDFELLPFTMYGSVVMRWGGGGRWLGGGREGVENQEVVCLHIRTKHPSRTNFNIHVFLTFVMYQWSVVLRMKDFKI